MYIGGAHRSVSAFALSSQLLVALFEVTLDENSAAEVRAVKVLSQRLPDPAVLAADPSSVLLSFLAFIEDFAHRVSRMKSMIFSPLRRAYQIVPNLVKRDSQMC